MGLGQRYRGLNGFHSLFVAVVPMVNFEVEKAVYRVERVLSANWVGYRLEPEVERLWMFQESIQLMQQIAIASLANLLKGQSLGQDE
jgi:hypothetical protein